MTDITADQRTDVINTLIITAEALEGTSPASIDTNAGAMPTHTASTIQSLVTTESRNTLRLSETKTTDTGRGVEAMEADMMSAAITDMRTSAVGMRKGGSPQHLMMHRERVIRHNTKWIMTPTPNAKDAL